MEVIEDGVSGAVNGAHGLEQIYRVLWKVPRPRGRAPGEISAEGRGRTVAEAQAETGTKHDKTTEVIVVVPWFKRD